MTKRIDQYAVFFAEIDNLMLHKKDVNQSRLFEIFGAERLRRYFLPLSFLVEDLRIEWSENAYENLIERKRMEATISRFGEEPWSGSLRDYFHYLITSHKKTLSAKSVRGYVAAAAGLLLQSRVKAMSELTSQHLAAFLESSPGNAASIRSFLRFANLTEVFESSVVGIFNPAEVRSEKRQMREFRKVAHSLRAADNPVRRRAMLAQIISEAYQVPLKQVLRIHKSDIKVTGEDVSLWPTTLGITLHHDLARDVQDLLSKSTTDLVFIGRNGIQSLSTTAVRYHVNAAKGSPSLRTVTPG